MTLISTFFNTIALGTIAFTSYVVLYVFYNLFLHPLRRFPGPLLGRATRLHSGYKTIQGVQHTHMLEMFRKYGDVVRIAPDELAFASAQAWKDIQGHRTPSNPNGDLDKARSFFVTVPDDPLTISNLDRKEHAMVRRMLAHGFSEKSMREQQPFITQYVDLFIQRMHEQCQQGTNAVDLASWYNFLTFDVIGDLAFGEPFGSLLNSGYHPWVKNIFSLLRVGVILQTLNHWPTIKSMLFSLVPKEGMKKHKELTIAKTRKRMELGAERPDLVEGLVHAKGDFKLSLEEIEANAGVLVIAGSETTATLLSGATYLLLTNPHALNKLVDEIRSTFKSEDDIDFNTVSRMPYLLACLDEALRIYPPAPTAFPRMTPPEGSKINNQFIPGNTTVGLHQWAMYHLDRHFTLPNEFHPERWLGDPKFATDNKAAFNPFGHGSRNCIGKNLAYIEMRLILTRVLWNFDLTLAEDNVDWIQDQKVFVLWSKGPLKVYLKPVVRS